ncbi:hypothetical protein BX600DRAFT_432015 [Xylariales sp. PMI_506]|nr:hypothetical protein BX600DRAFT_432015 [Xylariales sp. PMI_506]
MPIGDLLAEITGEKGSPAPAITKTPNSSGTKRKANGEPSGDAGPTKHTKQSHPISRDAVPTRPLPSAARPAPGLKSTLSTANGQRSVTTPSTASSGQRYTGTSTSGAATKKPSEISGALPSRRDGISSDKMRLNSGLPGASKVAPAKPSPTTGSAASVTSKVPKKGSFAEIMARGAKAQQIAPKVGIIQHKAIAESVPTKKEREELRRKQKWKGAKKDAERGPGGPALKDKQAEVLKSSNPRSAVAATKTKGSTNSAAVDMSERKVKKSATATTGYTGTSRAQPKKPSDSRNGQATSSRPRPAGGLLAPPTSRHRNRYEDDSDMDDFIDDDGGEEEVPRYGRYRYADEYESDGSSDMEAGADDIYLEELRAERQARAEDAREQAMLESLAREKEAKKRSTR